MTDTQKAFIIGVGLTIAAWLAGVMLRPLSLMMTGIITGPGMLVQGLLGRTTLPGCFLWFVGAVLQLIILYFLSLTAYRRPLLWNLRIGLLALAWVGAGIAGWLIVR
jgi:hypothetical protein